MRKTTVIGLSVLLLGMVPIACGSDSDGDPDPFVPPNGGAAGSFNPGGGGHGQGTGAYGASGGYGGDVDAGNAGNAGEGGQDSGPPSCADEFKRCAVEFTYPAGSETSVEVRGSYAKDGWDQGIALNKSGASWRASVDVPYNFPFTYKFVIDGTNWVPDPNNPNQVDDGQGGKKSVMAPQVCTTWTCATDPAPGACGEAQRTCDYKFQYPFGGESSVTLKGSFDSWGAGKPMTHQGSQWVTYVPKVPWGSSVEYKFEVNGTGAWVVDPNNPDKVSDGYGGFNSVIDDATCEWWACDGSGNPNAFDWRDAVIYFVFTDRFNNGNKANDGTPTGSGVQPAADYQGGDFAGVTEKINANYFDDLGVNVLWISPPMDNTSSAGKGVSGDQHMYSAYHGYWPSHLDQTEEHFGTMAELKALVDAAHLHKIRILFDYPMNHVHKDSPVYANHPGWFWQPPCICGEGCSWEGAEGKKCWFTDYLPDFNYTIKEARDFSVNNALWWVNQTGIDGFRLDAVKHIEDQWVYDLRSKLNTDVEPKTGEHFYLVGETFTGDRNTIGYYVKPSMLDGQFEFPLRLKLVSTLLMRTEPMSALDSELGAYESAYGSSSVMSTFVGNHDVPRSIEFAQNQPISTNVWYDGKDRAWNNKPGLPGEPQAFERLGNAFTVLFTIKGAPLVYYGDEIGLPGAGDPDNRRFMQWTGWNAAQQKLRDHVAKLGKIRAEHKALRRGSRSKVFVSNDVYAYKMQTAGDTVYVVVNRGDSQQQATGLPSGSLTDLLTSSIVSGPSVTVPARSSLVLVSK